MTINEFCTAYEPGDIVLVHGQPQPILMLGKDVDEHDVIGVMDVDEPVDHFENLNGNAVVIDFGSRRMLGFATYKNWRLTCTDRQGHTYSAVNRDPTTFRNTLDMRYLREKQPRSPYR